VEMTQHGRSVQEFSTYGPKAFASTKDLDPDLRDRCIRIQMVRTSKKLPDLEGWEPVWPQIRDMMFRFLLTNWPAVRAAYSRTAGDGSRNTELWRPIQAIMVALLVETSTIDDTREFFLGATETTRHELTEWEERLFDVLLDRAEGAVSSFDMTPEEIILRMDIDGEKIPSPRWVGGALTQFSLYHKKTRPKEGRTRITKYSFLPDNIRNMAKKYFRDTTRNNVSPCPQDEFSSDDADLNGAQEKRGTCHNVSPCPDGTEGNTYERVHGKEKCTTKDFEFTQEFDKGTQVHVNQGGIQGKVFHKDIDLTDGEPIL
jgi:hypothetical protein